MKSSLKIIALTAIATTLAWAAAITGFNSLWMRPATDFESVLLDVVHNDGLFFGTAVVRKTNHNDVVISIEQVSIGTNGTHRVELVRERLPAGGSVTVGVRKVSEKPEWAGGKQP